MTKPTRRKEESTRSNGKLPKFGSHPYAIAALERTDSYPRNKRANVAVVIDNKWGADFIARAVRSVPLAKSYCLRASGNIFIWDVEYYLERNPAPWVDFKWSEVELMTVVDGKISYENYACGKCANEIACKSQGAPDTFGVRSSEIQDCVINSHVRSGQDVSRSILSLADDEDVYIEKDINYLWTGGEYKIDFYGPGILDKIAVAKFGGFASEVERLVAMVKKRPTTVFGRGNKDAVRGLSLSIDHIRRMRVIQQYGL